MEFILIWDWVDEDDGFLYEQHADFFATKEQLFEAKKKAEKEYSWQVTIGRLILSPAIGISRLILSPAVTGYSWADIERLFQLSLIQFVV